VVSECSSARSGYNSQEVVVAAFPERSETDFPEAEEDVGEEGVIVLVEWTDGNLQ
jgi:hypothetical protein